MRPSGYVRLSEADLQQIFLVHLISGVDEDRPEDDGAASVLPAISGYTEWISESDKVLTVGWDWLMRYGAKGTWLERASEPRSNMMVQDVDDEDVGPQHSAELLARFIDNFDWQKETLQYISNRYRN